MSQKLNKNISAFDYFGKTLILLSATSGGTSIISFSSVIGAPAGIASASLSLVFSLTTGIIKLFLKITRKKKKKHNKIVMLARGKLNSIEALIFQALTDLEINHEEYKSFNNEEKNYRILKENIRMMKRDAEKDELNEEESKKNRNQ